MSMLPPTPPSRVNVPGTGLVATGVLGIIASLGWMLLWALGGIAALAEEDPAAAATAATTARRSRGGRGCRGSW